MLTSENNKAIIEHTKSCYPKESCGVLLKNKEYIPCANIAKHDAQFEICPRDLVKASTKGEILAYVHSHPDGTCNMSIPDKVEMTHHKLPWIITDGLDVELHPYSEFKAPLLGRPYYHGLLDCYTLVKDYYQRELDITLNDYKRDDIWWEDAKSKPLYLDNFKNEGFVEVDTIQQHDLILVRLGRTEHVNHALVFIGDGTLKSEHTDAVIGDSLVLHHPYNRDSLREIYGEQWMRRKAMIIRHKSLI